MAIGKSEVPVITPKPRGELEMLRDLVDSLIKHCGKIDAPPRFTTVDEALIYFGLEPTDEAKEAAKKAKEEAEARNRAVAEKLAKEKEAAEKETAIRAEAAAKLIEAAKPSPSIGPR